MQETSIGGLNRGEEKIQRGKLGKSRTLVGKLWKLVLATNFKLGFFFFFISTPVRIVSFFIFKKAETSFQRKMGWLIWEIKLIRTSGGQTDDLKKGRNETQAQ